jgi:prepilin-type N-terminal cleavage/methylation domain-containing protein
MRGFSLIELMVAMSLFCLVLIGGFTIFTTIEAGYVKEAGYARSSRITSRHADALFLAMRDNSSFSAHAVPVWPQDGEGDGLLSLTPLWDNASMLNPSGGYICRVHAIDLALPGFSLPATCLDAAGVSASALDRLTEYDLPSILIMDAGEGCILRAWERSGPLITFRVSRQACLQKSGSVTVHMGASDGSGVIFPRYLIDAPSGPTPIRSAFFDHPETSKDGAGLHFGQNVNGLSQDGSLYTISSTLPGDDFTATWVNIHQFGQARAFHLVNPLGLEAFTLKLDALSATSQLATSRTGAGASGRILRVFSSAHALEQFLQNLYLRSATPIATLRLHLGAGDTVWVRDLMLEMR